MRIISECSKKVSKLIRIDIFSRSVEHSLLPTPLHATFMKEENVFLPAIDYSRKKGWHGNFYGRYLFRAAVS